ncbi:MAG: rod shape-determining protein MreC [Gammaproteobacteria bacterium]|nr:rod shape-determining protein MreC [Gammaproteobacteria bacterium]
MQGPSLTIRLIIFSLISIALISADHRDKHLENIRKGLTVLLYPVQYAINLPISAVSWLNESLTLRSTLSEQNERLHDENLVLKARLQKFSALEAENVRLRELLDSSPKAGERVLIAELLSIDMDPFRRQVVINKGSNHNVFSGQPVLDANGIMGQVIHLSPLSSMVTLITDPTHAIPVQINRNGLRAIAIGTGTLNQLEIPHIPNNADIQEGDLLVSSGLGGRFPSGYPVARILKIDRNPAVPFARIIAEPTAQLERNKEVLLVWSSTPDAGVEAQPVLQQTGESK